MGILKKLKFINLEKSEKNLIINIIAAFAIKGLSLIISLFSTPQYIKFFGDNNVLGVWYTILSVLSWITICDLGLGNGLRNKLTQALAAGENEKAKSYISSAYVAIAAIILPITIIGTFAVQFLDLNKFLKLDPKVISPDTINLAVCILFVGVCLNFIFKTVNSILYAIQKSSVTNLLALVTSVIPLVYIIVFKSDNMEFNLISLSIVHVLASALPLLVATAYVFIKPLRTCAPNPKLFTKSAAKDVMGLGLGFFAAQIFFMILMSTNELFINTLYLPDNVVEYNIYYKVFTVVGSVFMLALTPLWSKITQDIARKRFHILKKTNNLLYAVSALAFAAQFAMLPVLQWFLNFWLGENTITVDYSTAAIFAFFGGVFIFNNALNTIANGMGDLKTQVIIYGVAAALKVPAIILLKNLFNSWNVIVLYNAIALALFSMIQFIYTQSKIRTLSKQIIDNETDLSTQDNREECSYVVDIAENKAQSTAEN